MRNRGPRPWIRRTLTSVTVVLTTATLPAPLAAEPGQLIYRDQGGLRMGRLTDHTELTRQCGVRRPRIVRVAVTVTLYAGAREQSFLAVTADEEPGIFLRASEGPFVDEGTWCAAGGTVGATLTDARTLPANDGPWLGLIVGFGAIALAVLLIAALGGGIGPRPEIGTASAPHPEGTGDGH